MLDILAKAVAASSEARLVETHILAVVSIKASIFSIPTHNCHQDSPNLANSSNATGISLDIPIIFFLSSSNCSVVASTVFSTPVKAVSKSKDAVINQTNQSFNKVKTLTNA